MLLPIYDGHWTESSAGHRTIKESCLETLNTFASKMEAATEEAGSGQQMTWPISTMSIGGKHLYMQLETKSGSMGRTSL